MWNIYGKKYDLTTFIKYHPGGSEILEKTRNLADCTALFESYHAFSDIESIRKSLDKYEILETDSDIKNEYNTDFTTYHKLIEKVKTAYPNREYIKASTSWYMWNISSILLYINVINVINLIQYTFLKCFFSKILADIEPLTDAVEALLQHLLCLKFQTIGVCFEPAPWASEFCCRIAEFRNCIQRLKGL
jgi:cytochrome b involved in lipid metabolism